MIGRTVRWLRNHKAVLAVLVLALLALLSLEGFRYVRAYQDLRDGKDMLATAADRLEERGLDVTSGELDESEEEFLRAQEEIDSASGVLDSDPLLTVASWLPWIGTQVDAARDLADIGVQSADLGAGTVDAMREFQRVRDTQGGDLSEKLVPLLDALEPKVSVIEQRLSAVRERRAEITDAGLLGPLSSARAQLDDRITDLETRLTDYRSASRMAPKVLGYDGPQTYLVLAHDNTELLATGGVILVYGFLTFDQGRLERTFFDSIANIAEVWPPTDGRDYIEPPAPLKAHLLVAGWPMGLATASWWPDFPTAAQNAIEIYRVNSGSEEHIDGVIGINFLTLERLVEALGPVTVEQYGETVTSDNVLEKTLIITHPDSLRPWETDRYDFTGYLAREVIEQTLRAGPSEWTPLLSALDTLGREKNLLLYHSDPAVQAAIADFGWAGRIRQDAGDYVMVVDTNLRRNKLSQVVETTIDLVVRLDGQGNATNVATISFSNDYSSWAQGKDPRLVALTTAYGRSTIHGGYLRLIAPKDSTLEEIAIGGLPVEAEEISIENSRRVFGRYFSVPLDASQQVTYTYVVSSVVDMSNNPYEYRLFIQKQPGTRAIPLTINVQVPSGMEVVSTELDGEDLRGPPTEIVTDLQEDRQVVVRYAPRR